MKYWEKRQAEAMTALEDDEAKIKRRVLDILSSERDRLNAKIGTYYATYGREGVIEFRELMVRLPKQDAALLWQDWDAFATKYPQYSHLAPVRRSIYKLNRLEGLASWARYYAYETAAQSAPLIQAHLMKYAARGAKDASLVLGHEYNAAILENFAGIKWSDGSDFSTHLWQNTQRLADSLNHEISVGYARGDSYQKMTRATADRFNVAKNAAYRLIYTEGTHVYNESSARVFANDFSQYRLSTAEDGKVCDTCRAIAKQTFNFKDRQTGLNFPPLHPWCRCSFTVITQGEGESRLDVINRLAGDTV